MPLRPRLSTMTVGLSIGITAAVVVACGAGAYLYSVHHFESLLDTARASALAQGDLIRVALEHQMIENDRSLIGRMVESFARQPNVASVALLDREGVERFTSDPREAGTRLHLASPTCQACHRYPVAQRARTRVIELAGSPILRTVVPFPNHQACHGCHDPAHRINGILIVDYDAGEIRAAMDRDLPWMVLGSGAIMLALIAAIALVVRLVVLKRLQRFEVAARQIAAGDLAQRVPAGGSDTLAWLAREFNTMADSMTGLVGEVRSQRERLETIINSIDDGIVVLDPSRRIVAANDAFLQRTGRQRDEVMGCCCRDAAPGLCGAGDCPTAACLQTGDRQVRILERQARDGTVACEEVHTSPIRDLSGRTTHVVEVWRDISSRRAAEARLAESHRLASLGILASGFSHELNTPLATVLTCVEGILRDTRPGAPAPDPGRIAGNATIAREQVLRCRGITQHFLRLSRGQASAGDVVNLARAVEAVDRLIAPTARAHGVDVLVEPPDPSVCVTADEAELQHALINLVLNAVQACAPTGRVTVQVDGGDVVRVRVRDNGCGIPSEFQARIFEPFFSLRTGGTGLGLFLALNFIRRWGGDIRVGSSPGQGSTFDVVLPAAGSAARHALAS